MMVQMVNERNDIAEHVILVLQMAPDAIARVRLAVVPAFAVDRGDAVELQRPVFQFRRDASIMPRSSYSKNAPIDEGKTIIGGPA